MTVTFFGHADFREGGREKEEMLSLFRRELDGMAVTFLLGGRGGFDEFARSCAREYQKENPLCTLVLVTPYLSLSFQKNHLSSGRERYDEILYPPLESVPSRFAILHRNQYMAKAADLVIVHVLQNFGGAYQGLLAARRAGKRILHFPEKSI